MTKREALERQRMVDRLGRMTGGRATVEDFATLRRASMTLWRWAERECGDQYGRCVERDEKTGVPYETFDRPDGKRGRRRVADLEAGALRRVREVCAHLGLSYYHQTDPRGCALYVLDVPMTECDYHNGLAIY